MPSRVLDPRLRHEPLIRRPRAARWRRTRFRWPTYPSTRRRRGLSASRCRSLRHRGATEPTKFPLCADEYYKSGAMLEHLARHALHAAAPVEDREATPHILQGRAWRSLWHALYAQRPPPPKDGWQRGGPGGGRGGIRSGLGSRQCSPSGFHPRWTGPPGPPVGPLGSRLPTPNGPGTPRGPGCPSGPRRNAGTGQMTPGGCGGRRPLAPLLEPAQRPRPTGAISRGHTPTTPGAGGLYQ